MKTRIRQFELGGIIPAVATPMTNDDEVDYAAYGRQISFLAESGVHGLFINGIMEEGPYPTKEERRECFEVARSNRRKQQFLVVVPPSFCGFDGLNIARHFLTVAFSIEPPIIIYNISQRISNDVFSGNLQSLLQPDRFAGIKDSSGDFARFLKVLHTTNGSIAREKQEEISGYRRAA